MVSTDCQGIETDSDSRTLHAAVMGTCVRMMRMYPLASLARHRRC